jgi:hypothetical protein
VLPGLGARAGAAYDGTVRLSIALLVLLLATAAADAGPRGGRFTIFAGGREAGSEIVSVLSDDETIRVESRATLHRDHRRQELRLTLVVDARTGRVRSLVAQKTQAVVGEEVGRVRRDVTLAATGGRLLGERREAESARVIDLESRDGEAVIAEPFCAPYLLLLSRYDLGRGGVQSFPALYPVEGRTGRVTLELMADQAMELDGRAIVARRVSVRPDHGDPVNVWLDEEGRMIVCARSVAGISAVRGRALRIGLSPGEDPPDPAGVRSMRIRFTAGSQIMAATLTKPEVPAERGPAVLLLAGSGPQDRNGNVPGAELQWNFLHSIAVELARHGIASLRYDERGVGRSGGSFHEAGLTDFVEDARAALAYLRSRDDVDPGQVAIFGHSEGALIGARLALEKPAVRALVTAGAPALPLDRILLSQVEAGLLRRKTPEREAQQILGGMRAFFEHVRLGTADVMTWQGQSREVRWLREHMELDPMDLFGRVRVPTFVVHGERDIQVPATHAERVHSALARAEFQVLAGLDHFLMQTSKGLADYGDPDRRVKPEALRLVGTWLARNLSN